MATDILKLARRFSAKSDNNSLHLEFISELRNLENIDILKRLLSIDYPLLGGLILERIRDVLPYEDSGLFLNLAFWNYFNGQDEDAFKYLERAKLIDPASCDVLRSQIWLSFNLPTADIENSCDELLSLYPEDSWALAIKKQLASGKQIAEMTQPKLSNVWDEAICQK